MSPLKPFPAFNLTKDVDKIVITSDAVSETQTITLRSQNHLNKIAQHYGYQNPILGGQILTSGDYVEIQPAKENWEKKYNEQKKKNDELRDSIKLLQAENDKFRNMPKLPGNSVQEIPKDSTGWVDIDRIVAIGDAQPFDPEEAGTRVAVALESAWTDDSDGEYINKALSELDRSNIMKFLNAYFKETGRLDTDDHDQEIIFEFIDDDCGEEVTMANKQNLLKSLMDYASYRGKEGNANFKKLAKIFADWKRSYSGEPYFNQSYPGECNTNYNEMLDKYFLALYKEL